MCKRDAESVKVAPESVLSNRRHLEGTHLTGESSLRVRFSLGLSPREGGYLRTPWVQVCEWVTQ